MLTVCYYGEFDPFSGSVDQHDESLDDVVRVLAMLCLLYDVVIVPPGALLEHVLGLPAFERLAPFVRAGCLGTTAAPSEPGPRVYMVERVRRLVEARSGRRAGSPRPGARPAPGRRSALDRLQARDFVEIQRRLSDILPEQWTLTRDVARQVSGCDERIRRFCETTGATMSAAQKLLARMNAARHVVRTGATRVLSPSPLPGGAPLLIPRLSPLPAPPPSHASPDARPSPA